jgi:hypothetical protein
MRRRVVTRSRSPMPGSSAPKTESESSSSRQQSESGRGVADVPDQALEALNVVRTLKQSAYYDELPSGRMLAASDCGIRRGEEAC